jgi:hypothetical protein
LIVTANDKGKIKIKKIKDNTAAAGDINPPSLVFLQIKP